MGVHNKRVKLPKFRELAIKSGLSYHTIYSRWQKNKRLSDTELMKKPVSRNGKKKTRYGGRTFEGWSVYYAIHSQCGRHPGVRTIQSSYAKYRRQGYSEDEIVHMQKQLWKYGVTQRSDKYVPFKPGDPIPEEA